MARAGRETGRDETRIRSGELAALCMVDRVQLARALSRLGVSTAGGWVDLIEVTRAVVSASRAKKRGSDTDDPGALSVAKLREEVANLEARRAWVRTRIRTLRREWVRVAELHDKLGRLSSTLVRAGEQLGQRFGPDAQELFNAAIEAGVRAIVGKSTVEKKPRKSRRSHGKRS